MRDVTGVRLLPRSVLVAIAVLGLSVLAVGLFLEWRHTAWLQSHPITSNLISSIVGFCTVTLVVGLGFAALSERTAAGRLRELRAQDETTLALTVSSTVGRLIRHLPTWHDRGPYGGEVVADTRPVGVSLQVRRLTTALRQATRLHRGAAEEALADAEWLCVSQLQPFVERHLLDTDSGFGVSFLAGTTGILRDAHTQLTAAVAATGAAKPESGGYPTEYMANQLTEGLAPFAATLARFYDNVIRLLDECEDQRDPWPPG